MWKYFRIFMLLKYYLTATQVTYWAYRENCTYIIRDLSTTISSKWSSLASLIKQPNLTCFLIYCNITYNITSLWNILEKNNLNITKPLYITFNLPALQKLEGQVKWDHVKTITNSKKAGWRGHLLLLLA